jgi:hypothetical protein
VAAGALGHLAGDAVLADDEETVAGTDDLLELRLLVPGLDEKPARALPRLLVDPQRPGDPAGRRGASTTRALSRFSP